LPSPGKPVPAAPQQSLSLRHKSPSTRQPLAGWHTFTPVAAKGAQSRLQQLLQSPQTVPSIPPEQNVEPLGGGAQIPSVPVPISQVPEQQVPLWLQTSPDWMQYDAPNWQVPPLHNVEQH